MSAPHQRPAGEPDMLLRVVSDSVEEMEATFSHFGVDARFHQMEPGPLHVEIVSRRLPRSWLTRRSATRALDTTLKLADGFAGIRILTRSPNEMMLCGASVLPGDTIVARPGAVLEMTSPAGAEFISLDVRADTLQSICDSLSVPAPHDIAVETEVYTLSHDTLRAVHSLARDVLRLRQPESENGIAQESVALKERESVLLARLCASFAESRFEGSKAVSGGSGKAFIRARRYIEQRLGEPLRLEDLCEASGVSLRTLQATFRAHTGVSPMVYVRLRRLNEAHRMLRRGDASTTSVTDVALACGFTHLARFAGYYRDHFGVRPSETLRAIG